MSSPPSPAARPCPLDLGIEEEFHLVSLATRRLTSAAPPLLERLRLVAQQDADGANDRRRMPAGGYAAELQQSVVETNSAVTTDLEQLRRHLVALRAELIDTAEPLGVGIAAAGTMPLSVPLALTPTARFAHMLAEYQLLVREQLICSMQVHVGIDDRDVAVRLLDRVSPWLPALLALSASSPFSHTGADTGYASSRSLIWTRWPTTGRAGTFASAAEYDQLTRDLVGSGVISDSGMLYFDVRPSQHVPTLELRVCDACPSVDTAVLIAGLFRGVVARELARLRAGEPSAALPVTLERAAHWRAARSGLEGDLLDLSGRRAVPAAQLLRSLLAELRPELEAHGDASLLEGLLEAELARGSAAARQRRALQARGDVRDVVDLILAETRGAQPSPQLSRTTPDAEQVSARG